VRLEYIDEDTAYIHVKKLHWYYSCAFRVFPKTGIHYQILGHSFDEPLLAQADFNKSRHLARVKKWEGLAETEPIDTSNW